MEKVIILTADQLIALETERWAHRRTARETSTALRILQGFLDHGGSVAIQDIGDARSLTRLNDDDLICLRDGRIDIAYPFSASPTAFMVRLADGRERYACCATDALGFAPMIGQRVSIHSVCHGSGALLAFSVNPDGPEPNAAGIMVWSGKRAEEQCRSIDGL